MRLIVTSQQDIAGSNIYKLLARDFGFGQDGEFEGKPIYKRGRVWLIATEKGQVEAEHLDKFFDPEYYVFASRHRSESGERTLTVHVPGNLTKKAEVGGRPEELSFCNSSAMKVALMELEKGRKKLNLDYKVSMEATHHGPTRLEKPVLFVEVGSTESEWCDERAVGVVAKAALEAAENTEEFTKVIGIGGNHYAPVHTRAVLESDIAIGHIIPTYAINGVREDVFSKAIERTGAEFGFLDWKGMKKEHKDKMKDFASKCSLALKRGKDIKKAIHYPEFEIEKEFFDAAVKANRKIIADAIAKHGGIPKTEENGSLSNRIQSTEDTRWQVIEACIKSLGQKFELEFDGSLILKEKKLDVTLAEKFGIKPGPVLGKILEGQAVEIDSVRVTRDMLVKEETRIIEIKERLTRDVIKALL